MPNSQRSTRPDDVKAYLSGLVPQATFAGVETDAASGPLLIVQIGHFLAAFAFSNSDIAASYVKSYGAFRDLYSRHQAQWDRLDLAFVLCVPPDAPDLSRFSSDIETDVYFCRKFVVPIFDSLGHSLARLPFLPLVRLDGQSLRPPSAQTFLQRCGVPAVLAKNIVVPHQRSADGIVQDCISGMFGAPGELLAVDNSLTGEIEAATNPIQIDSIVIENFRAYRRPQQFKIGKAVTILYGPNGFGKTSFFDAIDFVVTGGIGRLESASEARFEKIAAHLDSRPEDAAVTLNFRRDDAQHKIVRTVSDRRRALLDNRETDRKSILTQLTGGGESVADRIENFVSLFRATHLFSQENQELAKHFHDNCSLDSKVVSRMLAFEDYANAVSKAAEICSVLQGEINHASEEIETLSKSLEADKLELNQLRRTTEDSANLGALNAAIEQLRTGLMEIGIDTDASPVDATVLRGWRASLETRIAESNSTAARLSTVAKEIAGLPQLRTEATNLEALILDRERRREAAEKEWAALGLKLQPVENRAVTLKDMRTRALAELDALKWLREQKPIYLQLTARRSSLLTDIERLTKTTSELRDRESAAKADLDRQTSLAENAELTRVSANRRLARLEAVSNSMPGWQADAARLSEIGSIERTSGQALQELRAAEPTLVESVNNVDAELGRLSRLIADTDRAQSDVKQLLSQLQGHIASGTCPLCGEDHGTQTELVRRIQEQLSADAASGARAELASAKVRRDELARQLAANRQSQQSLRNQLNELSAERKTLDVNVARYRNSAISLDLNPEKSAPKLPEQLAEATALVRGQIDQSSHDMQAAIASAGTAHALLSEVQTLLKDATARLASARSSSSRVQRQTTLLRNDSRAKTVPLEAPDEDIDRVERERTTELSRLGELAVTADADFERVQQEVSIAARTIESLRNDITAARTRLNSVQQTVSGITGRLQETRLPEDADEGELLGLINAEARLQAQLRTLQQTTANIELGVDAATTAAALSRLRSRVIQQEGSLAEAQAKREAHSQWNSYFEDISELVSSERNQAIDSFTRDYGPRTSVIQRRLRSVYGFDDIEIQSDEGKIVVSARRHGEDLPPTDYFSQSQQQTLLLGLFLAACSSQNWSAFSPVFLDDPVTNFDDLNTYALLDLIVGLLGSDIGRRQFIISTCDDKLFQLARQKFDYLGDGAQFHRFKSIGEDGPVVETLSRQ